MAFFHVSSNPFVSLFKEMATHKCIAIKPKHMIRIHLSDRRFQPLVESRQSPVLGIARFVDGIVAGNPRISSVSSGDLLPEPDDAVLVVLVVPKGCVVGWVVGMPI